MMENPVIVERHDLMLPRALRPALRTSRGLQPGWDPERQRVLTLVKGTEHGEWADPGSPLRTQVLEPSGITIAARVEYWTGALWAPKDDWRMGGDFLAETLSRLELEERNLLVHSHGLNVAVHAAKQLPINRLTAIAGPLRPDLFDVYEQAAENTARWTDVRDTGFDKTAWLGQWFGFGQWFRPGKLPRRANVLQIKIPGIGHSTLLYESRQFYLWEREALTAQVA